MYALVYVGDYGKSISQSSSHAANSGFLASPNRERNLRGSMSSSSNGSPDGMRFNLAHVYRGSGGGLRRAIIKWSSRCFSMSDRVQKFLFPVRTDFEGINYIQTISNAAVFWETSACWSWQTPWATTKASAMLNGEANKKFNLPLSTSVNTETGLWPHLSYTCSIEKLTAKYQLRGKNG